MTRLFDHCRCTEDVQRVKLDPTGTAKIRRRFNTLLALHWRRTRVMARQAIVNQNILGLAKGPSSMGVSAVISGVPVMTMFQRWIDNVLQGTVLENGGSFVRQYIQAGYDAGVAHAQRELGEKIVPSLSDVDRIGTLSALAYVELQGIAEAVSQQVVRVVANALLTKKPANKVALRVQAVIDSVGVMRSTAMVELLVVKAFAEATLDVFEAAGVDQVGLVPEMVPGRKPMSDAKRRRTGPGSRSPRNKTPSRSTINRIKKMERELEKIGRVNVETAEDDKVCNICARISEDGPYNINTARTLIPAHPHCRCIFVPVRRKRKGDEQTLDHNECHEPAGSMN